MAFSISLRKTGIVVFGARIASIFTGLVFLVMMTRYLSAQQFGLYEVITDLVTFGAYPAGVVTFWATRDVARGKMFGRTAVVLNLALSALGVALYIVLSVLSSYRIASASLGTLFFAGLLVPVSYLNQAGNSVVQGHRPVVMGYAVITSEASKLLVAYPLLIVYKVGIEGVILAVFAANLAQSITSIALAGDAMSSPVTGAQARKWLTHGWLPMLTTLPLMMGVADTFVASIAAGGTTLVGHYQAAFSVATLAGYSLYLATAMYPLLLKGGSDDVAMMTLDLTLVFGIPMAVAAAVLASPILHLLNPQYADASTALAILAITAVFITVASVFDALLIGKDRVDVNEDSNFAAYLRSSIVFVAKANIALATAYLVLVFSSVYAGIALGLSRGETIDLWAVSQLAVFIASISVKARRVRSVGNVTVPRSLAYYIGAAVVMAGVLYLLEPLIVYGKGTFYLAGELVLVGVAGLAVYAAIVLALDRTMRQFLARALRQTLG